MGYMEKISMVEYNHNYNIKKRYKCKFCEFKTRLKYNFNTHMLEHKQQIEELDTVGKIK